MAGADSVVDIGRARWGVELVVPSARFAQGGWSYREVVAHPCPGCSGELHSLRKPYVTKQGRAQEFVALVCPQCPACLTLKDLGLSGYSQLGRRPSVQRPGVPATSSRASSAASTKDPRADVVRYWRAVELFGAAPSLESASDRERRYEPQDRGPAPWEPGHRLARAPIDRSKNDWRHGVYGGIYQLDRLHESLGRVFGENGIDVDERTPRGRSALFTVQVTGDGRLLLDTFVLSSAAWALGRAHHPGPTHSRWLDGFQEAESALRATIEEVLVVAEDDERGRSLNKRGVRSTRPVEYEVLERLVRHIAESLGIENEIAPRGLQIQSRQVALGSEEEAQPELLNSLFADDLERVADAVSVGEYGTGLAQYLRGDGPGRIDVRDPAQRDGLIDRLSPAKIPAGRWPTDPAHSLAASQQLAINVICGDFSQQPGLFAVNGPPGTGKTTMLRDVVAAVVTERARVLAALPRPDAAFRAEPLRWRTARFQQTFYPLVDELTGFEMLVASSNNTAVENLSRELPGRDEVDSRWADAGPFADVAERLLGAPAWALVAADLGRKAKRGRFVSGLWFDDDTTYGLEDEPKVGRWLHAAQQNDGPAQWEPAVARFQSAMAVEDRLRRERQEVHLSLRALPGLTLDEQQAHRVADRARAEAEQRRQEAEVAALWFDRAHAAAEASRTRRHEHRTVKPGWLENLLAVFSAERRGHVNRWHEEDEALAVRERATEAEALSAEDDARRTREQADGAARRSAEADEQAHRTEAARAAAQAVVTQFRGTTDAVLPDGDWTPTGRGDNPAAPWLDAPWNAARTEVFLAALNLHRAFFAASGDKGRRLVQAAANAVQGNVPADVATSTHLAAWQGLFLLVPVASTTFASVGRMLGHLESESFGWLLVDEAGQAPPPAAAGAIWRCRRTVAVGDPLQIEPVVTVLHSTESRLRDNHGVDPRWAADRESVQTLVDRVTPLGTTLAGPDGDDLWVGAPLTVHRRCDDPMFSVVNDVVYGGLMTHGDPGAAAKYDEAHPDLESSGWVAVRSPDADSHWIPAEGAALDRLLGYLVDDQGIDPTDIMVIGPFRAVGNGIGRVLKARGLADDITHGTVHVSQGKQADVVIVVLGGNPAKPGARAWVAQRPNMMNVAVSRAKHRLYVIGDHQSWREQNYFSELARRLPVGIF